MTVDVEPTRLTPRERIVFAVFGGLYLVWTVAWLFAAQANQLIGVTDRFIQGMQNFGEFFAIVSPGLWFFATFSQLVSTRARIVALVIGLAVLFPFPLFFGVMVA